MRFQKFASSSSLVGKTNFRGMVWSINYSPTHLSMEEAVVRVSHEVLLEVDDNRVLIVGNPGGIKC
jgi:hypothetical protein